MTEDERKRYEQMILDHHAAALESSRQLFDGLNRLRAHLQRIADRIEQSRATQDKAINEMLAANQAAIRLYNEEKHG